MSAQAILERAVRLRQDLHRHPELSWKEQRTAELIIQELERLEIAWHWCAAPGLVAEIPGGSGPRVALRADMDALPVQERTGLQHASTIPGVMHACGHDGHMATLLAVAAWLKEQQQALAGPVRLLFQPAEEGGFGAREMVRANALDGVESVFGWHNMPTIPYGHVACPTGPIMACNGHFAGTLTGRGGHASQPDECDDVVLAGAAFVQWVQGLVARQTAPQDAVTVSVATIHAGVATNVMPDRLELGGTIRALTEGLRDQLATACETGFTSVATLHGVEAQFRFHPAYPATINEAHSADRLRQAVTGCQGLHLWTTRIPMMISEDFSFYLQARPGAFMLVGSGSADRRNEPCHSAAFDFDDRLIALVLKIYSQLLNLPSP